jgi:hypothetical protein
MYLKKGQSQAQQDRDRYECHTWAEGRTGYHPTPPPSMVTQAPPSAPQGGLVRGVAGGAAIGAIGGAIGGDAGKGAAIGAGVGAAGSAVRSRAGRQQQAEAQAARSTAAQQGIDAYRRAMSVCLEGRNYTVQ